MAERPRLPIAFGGGLDRYTGTTETQPAAFRDLRNVHLRRGGMEVRGGLDPALTVAGTDAILAVAAIRSLGIGALITWTEATRRVDLHLIGGDGTISPVGEVWTMPAGYARPRVVVTDSYDLLFIAHDEPAILARRATRVYKPATSTIIDLTADLYTGPGDPVGPQPMYFRGVARHLAYLVGWGYGSERPDDANGPGDKDRPEIVRMSLPGAPLSFDPNHYFLAGQRGEAVVSCQPTGNLLAVLKGAERYTIFGYDRATFGIRPADMLFGVAAQRLAISVNGVVYHWSHSGPRRSVGDAPSDDLSLPLDLGGPSPSQLATDADTLGGFATYDPAKREVIFCFGSWAYVLHVGEQGSERWSYREYGVVVASAGTLSLSASTGIGPDALALFVDAVADDYNTITVNWSADESAGALLGTERVELWGKPATTGLWSRLKVQQVTGNGTPPFTVDALSGTDYDLAVRLTLNGVASAGYTDSNPANWPAGAQGAVSLPLPTPVLTGRWVRTAADPGGTHEIRLGLAPLLSDAYVRTLVEFSTDGGATFNPIPGSPAAYGAAQIAHVTTALALDSPIKYQARYETDWATGDYGTLDTVVGVPATGVPMGNAVPMAGCRSLLTLQVPDSLAGDLVRLEPNIGTPITSEDPVDGTGGTVEIQITYVCGPTIGIRTRNEQEDIPGTVDVSPWTAGPDIELPCPVGETCA